MPWAERLGTAGRRAAKASVWLALTVANASALALDLGPHPVTASLWAERDGIAPGQPFTLGLHLVHAQGWHSYWTVPGDSGLPTRVSWRLPAGVRAGPIQWPAPRRLAIGPLVDYGYEGDTLLLTDLQPAADLPIGGEVRIEAHAQWLMCRDVCVPGSGDVSVTLPVRPPQASHPTAEAPAFELGRRRIPHELKLTSARATRSGSSITLTFEASVSGMPHRLEFFPLEPGRIEASAPQTLQASATTVRLQLTAAQPIGADFLHLSGVLVADGGSDERGGWIGTIEVPLAIGGP